MFNYPDAEKVRTKLTTLDSSPDRPLSPGTNDY